jgi:hypothetical protein
MQEMLAMKDELEFVACPSCRQAGGLFKEGSSLYCEICDNWNLIQEPTEADIELARSALMAL